MTAQSTQKFTVNFLPDETAVGETPESVEVFLNTHKAAELLQLSDIVKKESAKKITLERDLTFLTFVNEENKECPFKSVSSEIVVYKDQVYFQGDVYASEDVWEAGPLDIEEVRQAFT